MKLETVSRTLRPGETIELALPAPGSIQVWGHGMQHMVKPLVMKVVEAHFDQQSRKILITYTRPAWWHAILYRLWADKKGTIIRLCKARLGDRFMHREIGKDKEPKPPQWSYAITRDLDWLCINVGRQEFAFQIFNQPNNEQPQEPDK